MANRVLPSETLQSLFVRGRATCETVNGARFGCACYAPIGDADYDMATDATYFGRTLLRAEPSASNRTVTFSTARLDPYPEHYDGMIKLVLNSGDNNRLLTVDSLEGDFVAHTLAVGEMLVAVLSGGRWTVNAAGEQVWAYDVGTNTVSLVPAGASVEMGDLTVDGKLTVTGLIDPTGLVLDEQASIPTPPVAGKGVLWLRNDAPNRLIFTDDTGSSHILGAGTGDVVGPASATDTALAVYDGTTGKFIKNSSLTTATGTDLVVPGVATLGGTALPGTPTAIPNQVLVADGAGNAVWTTLSFGDVVGPASSTNNHLAIFDGTTGKLLKDSSPIVVNGGTVTNVTSLTVTNLTVVNTPIIGGTTFPLAPGLLDQILVADGAGNAVWTNPPYGDVFGPASSVDNHLALYNGATGKIIKDTSPIVVNVGAVTGVSSLTTTNLTVTNAPVLGGTTFPAAPGAATEILVADGAGNAVWTTPSYGDVARSGPTVDERLVRWDGTGASIQNSGVGLTDAGDMTGVRSFTASGGTITLNNHTWPASTGTNGYVLTTDGGSPATLTWTNPTSTLLWQTTTESTFSVLRPQASGITNTFCFGNVSPYDTGTGNRVFFDVAKGALRAGGTGASTWWQLSNVGTGSIGLGYNTSASGANAVALGTTSIASGDNATVGGGTANTASGDQSTVAGGQDNTASFQGATVSGGTDNTASGTGANVAGGVNNLSSGDYAVVAGGGGATVGTDRNEAAGDYSAVGGGRGNETTNAYGVAAGGQDNTVGGDHGTISGGQSNSVIGGATHVTIGGGQSHTANSNYATIGGGFDHTVSGVWATVSGGAGNAASAQNATIGGGIQNQGTNNQATVGGGAQNVASGLASTIAGGNENTASNDLASIAGGGFNTASADSTTVSGGRNNIASGGYATVGGGGGLAASDGNVASATWSTIGGGLGNAASNAYTTIGGGRDNTANAQYATIGGGQENSNTGFRSTVAGGYQNNATGASYASIGGGRGNSVIIGDGTVAGGQDNTSSGANASVGGGQENVASGAQSTVSGGGGSGTGNLASAVGSTVGGGTQNDATGGHSTIAGGQQNSATNDSDTVGGGQNNSAAGNYSTVVGGQNNSIPSSGTGATVAGGRNNTAGGNDSLVCGASASDGNFDNCFVFADGTALASGAANRATFGVAGGYYIYTNAAQSTGMFMAAGASAWSAVSERRLKTDIATVDYDRMLERVDVGDVNVYMYRMKERDAGHDAYNVGTMADEFATLAPKTGKPDTTIDHGDANGVNLALAIAIRRAQLADRKRIAALEKENDDLKKRLASIETALKL